MSNIAALSLLTYFSETTQGTAPADAAAWIANGVRLRHIADTLDISGVERQFLEDMRNQYRVKGNEPRVQSIDNPEFPFAVYGHGLGETTASGAQVATDAPGYQLMLLLSHAIGGISRGYSNTVSGAASTTTTVDVTDASNHAVGDFIAIEFQTAYGDYPVTTAWPRRITAINTGGAPHVITIDQALPQAPAAGDAVHACVTVYHDEDVLCDSAAAAGRTRSWLVQKGMPGAGASVRESWVFKGCVATLQQMSFARAGLLQFAFQVMAGSHDDPTDGIWPTAWSTNAELGLAPLAITPQTEVWCVTTGVTTNTLIHVSKFDVEPGVPRVRTETLTTSAAAMQGTYNYATQPADTTISMAITPFGIAQWTDQLAETEKILRWARLGPAGGGFAVHFPRVSHAMTPKRGVNNATTDVEVNLLAHEDTSGSNNLQRSTFCLVAW